MNAKSRNFYKGEGVAASLRLMADGIEARARENPLDYHTVHVGDRWCEVQPPQVNDFVRSLREFADSV